jgi:hypothetical protein
VCHLAAFPVESPQVGGDGYGEGRGRAFLQDGEVAEDGVLGDAEVASELADSLAAVAGEQVDQLEDADGTVDRQGSSLGGLLLVLRFSGSPVTSHRQMR